MRLTAWPLLAALSLAPATAASRPRYGGTLRLEMRDSAASLAEASAPEGIQRLAGLVFERLDALSTSWSADAARRRWEFHLRPGVRLHDGALLTPAVAAAALGPAARVAGADGVVLESERPLSEPPLLVARAPDNAPLGTGPFRLARWDSGKHATLSAFDDYWGGRPYLDSIEIELNRSLREQFLDLELGRADLVELGPAEVRRAAEHGRRIWSSAPIELLAVVFSGNGKSAEGRLREALALAIDRAAIYNVLLQRQGEITAAILPQWYSGYAFVFPTAPDLARARALAAQLAPAGRVFTLGYDGTDALARLVAERIAVNARDAGLAVQTVPGAAQPDARLVLAPALSMIPPAANPDALYQAERALLETHRVVPLAHLPVLAAASARVHAWLMPALTHQGAWRLADVWLSGGAP